MLENYKWFVPKTIFDWAAEAGWTDLQYNPLKKIWMGFPLGELVEKEVPPEIIRELSPHSLAVEFDSAQLEFQIIQMQLAQAFVNQRRESTVEFTDWMLYPETVCKYGDKLLRMSAANSRFRLALGAMCEYLAHEALYKENDYIRMES